MELDDSPSGDFDREYFDDDGEPLIDDSGNLLVPMDEAMESYDQDEAVHLITFAATYREVRKALQAHRVGRDQKYATIKGKGSSKGKSKGKNKGKKPFRRGHPLANRRKTSRRSTTVG